MKRPLLLLSLLLCTTGVILCAQSATTSESTPEIRIIDRAHAGDWSSDITFGWHFHQGDNSA